MKVLLWLDKHFEAVVLTAMLVLLTSLVLLQILMRYVVGNPLSWSEELCRLLLAWSGFFSIGYCVRKGSTIRLDTVVTLLPKAAQRVLNFLSSLVMLVLLCYLLQGAWRLVLSNIQMGSMLPGLGIPSYWLYIGPLAGIGLGVLRLVQSFILSRGFRTQSESAEKGGE